MCFLFILLAFKKHEENFEIIREEIDLTKEYEGSVWRQKKILILRIE